METYKTKWTRLQTEIFRFLCVKAGVTFNLRGVARPLGVSPTAVSNSLTGLEKAGLISVEKSKTMNLLTIELNRDNQNSIDLKRIENLRQIYESGLVSFLEDKFPGNTVILFGSYSRGDDSVYYVEGEEPFRRSDVDIAIVGTKGKEIDLAKFDKLLEREIIINFYLSFKEIHKHLRNNILNGILLSGSVDL